MRPTDAEVTAALDAVSVTRWTWVGRMGAGEAGERVEEAHATYARARAALVGLLEQEAEAEAQPSRGVPFGPTAPKYRRFPEPANGNGGANG